MAYAGFRYAPLLTCVPPAVDYSHRFVKSILKAVSGESGIVEETYLYLPGIPGGKEIAAELGVDYFAVPVEFGPQGAKKAYPIGPISDYEKKLLAIAVEELRGNVKKGIDFSSL
jgi:malate dehydrogenase